MPVNEYDALLAGATPAPANPYDALLDAQAEQNTVALKTSLRAATKTPPDAKAKAIALADRLRVPVELVERNPELFQQRDAIARVPYDALLARTPKLAAWLQDPQQAAVAQDDLETLGQLEHTLTFGAAILRGVDTVQQLGYGALEATGELIGDRTMAAAGAHGRAWNAQQAADLGGRSSVAAVFAGEADLGQYLKEVIGDQLPMLTPSVIGGVVGGALGSVLPGIGTTIGAAIGAGLPALVLGVGEVQSGIKEKAAAAPRVKTDLGAREAPFQAWYAAIAAQQGLDPNPDAAAQFYDYRGAYLAGAGPDAGGHWPSTFKLEGHPNLIVDGRNTQSGAAASAPGWAFLGGSAIGALDTVLPGKLGSKLVKTFGFAIAEQVARRALMTPIKTVAGGVATEGLTEAIQAAIGEVAAAAGAEVPVEWAALPGIMLEDLAAGGIVGGAVSVGAAGAEVRQARIAAALQGAAVLKGLGAQVTASKLAQRLPDAAEAFLAETTKDTALETVYAPLDSFTTYFQGKHLDPAAVAAALTGNPDAYATALRTGEDLAIPTAAYAVKIAASEHGAFFANEVRLAPDAMNKREGDAFAAELEAQAAAAPDAAAAPVAPVDAVRDNIRAQLLAAGDSAPIAETYAAVYGQFFTAVGARAGVDPLTLFNRYGLRVGRPELAKRGTDGDQQGGAARRGVGAPQARGAAEGGDRSGAEGGGVSPRSDPVVAGLVDAAVVSGFTGDPETLAAAIAARVALVQEIDAEVAAAGGSPEALLQAIAEGGGLGADAGFPGEIAALWEQSTGYVVPQKTAKGQGRQQRGRSLATGGFLGVKHVLRKKGGLSLDGMIEYLGQDPRFQHIASIADLLEELTSIGAGATQGTGAIDARRLGAVGDQWWELFQRGLFDAPAPVVDTLDTGEQQPRLPGAGEVRNAEVATPALEAPFALTSEVAQRKGKQTTLFQGPAPAPTFYSRLIRAVEESKQPKANGAQWKAQIANAKIGINQDEFAYARVADLEDGTVYTKEAVLAYLRANELAIVDVTLAGESGPDEEAVDALAEELRNEYINEQMNDFEFYGDVERVRGEARRGEDDEDGGETWTAWVGEKELDDYETEDEAREAAEEEADRLNDAEYDYQRNEAEEAERERLDNAAGLARFTAQAREELGGGDDTGVRYPEYQLKGPSRDYHEVFLTVPDVHAATDQTFDVTKVELRRSTPSVTQGTTTIYYDGQKVETFADDPQMLFDAGGTAQLDPYGRVKYAQRTNDYWFDVAERIFERGDKINRIPQRGVSWVDGHDAYDAIENPVVRLRFNTRDTAAGATLFLEEVQTPHADEFAKMPVLLQKNWRPLAFKWALRYAAEHDLAAVAWTSGAMQAARYSLEKEVKEITWRNLPGSPDGTRATVRGVGITTMHRGEIMFDVDLEGKVLKDGASAQAEAWAGAPLESIIGKGLADQVLGADVGTIAGDGLKVGGEGLKRLYDVDFKNVVQGLPAVKKLGGKVGTLAIVGVAPDGYDIVETPGGGMWRLVNTRTNLFVPAAPAFRTGAAAEAWLAANTAVGDVPALLLTPALKAAVLGGQTLFQPAPPVPPASRAPLLIQHNVTAANLLHAAKLGGLAVPSLAIAKAADTLTGFGEVTLIGPRAMADPQGYARTRVFGADIYSPRYPTIEYKFSAAAEKQIGALYRKHKAATGIDYYDLDELQKEGAKYLEQESVALMAEFLTQRGVALPAPVLVADRNMPRGYVPRPGQVDHFLTRRAFQDAIAAGGLEHEFHTFVAAFVADLAPTERIFKGFTDAGNRRYQAHTLENVVAILKKNMRGGESEHNIYGVGQLRSQFTPQFKSLAGIQGARDRIVSDADFEAAKDEIEAELFAIVADLKSSYLHDANRFGFVDTVMAVMADAAKLGLPRALSAYGFSLVPVETQQRVAAFLVALRRMPTEYFEAKITREVDLAEFRAAVVPENLDPAARFALESRGVEVFTYPAGSDPAARKAAVEAVARGLGDDVLFQPPPPDDPIPPENRARIQWGPNRQFNIDLLKTADLSSFLHETGHFMLEVFADAGDVIGETDPTALTDSQRQMLGDYGTVLQFLGVENRAEIGVAEHERFARAIEAYVMEGKAPSAELVPVFARIRAWLLGIYQDLRALNVELTPEVRAVFDRMLASDAAIAQAQAEAAIAPVFPDAEAGGMTAPEWAAYRHLVEQAPERAQTDLTQQLLTEFDREQAAWWTEARIAMRTRVEADLYAEPVYRALSALQYGTHPDGTPLVEGHPPAPMRLSKAAIVAEFGVEALKWLPRPHVYAADGALLPAAAAELFGFSSADALLQAMTAATPLRLAVETETDRRMRATHGDLFRDRGRLAARAREAVFGAHREAVVRAEWAALAKRKKAVAHAAAEQAYERRWLEAEAKLRIAIAEGHQQVVIDKLTDQLAELKAHAKQAPKTIAAAIPPAPLFAEAARKRVAATPVRNLHPQVFWAATQRAAREAIAAAAAQDLDAAIAAQQQQLLNLALYRETVRALADVETRVAAAKAFDQPASRRKIGRAGEGYQDQIDGILDRYEFAAVSRKALDRRASMRAWIAGLEADAMPVDLPEEVLDDARRVNYLELTYEALVGVTDGLTQIARLAQIKNQGLKAAGKEDFETTRNKLVTSIRRLNPTTDAKLEYRPADDRLRSVGDWFASHNKVARLARLLDGNVDGGAAWEAFIRPVNLAGDTEVTRKQAAATAIAAILEAHYPGRALGTLSEKVYIPAIRASLSKEGRLAVALNWGAEQNQQRLMSDPRRKWSRASIEAILNTLEAKDWMFVQAVWDYENSFWEEIVAKQTRVTGIAPEKVPAVPFVTRHGQQMRGGYHHINYDPRLTIRGQQHEAASEAQHSLAAAYVTRTTRRGHTKARVQNVKLSLRLDLGVLFNHVDDVIHDLTHHETMSDVTRLLRDPEVSKAILETRGDVVYQQFTKWADDVVAGGVPAKNMTDRAATYLRTRGQLALLGWNFWTGAQQPLGLFNGMRRVGPVWVAKGLKRWLRDAASLESTVAWIHAVSPMMRSRGATGTQDLVDVHTALRQPGGWFDTLLRATTWDTVTKQAFLDSYLWHIGIMQRVADVPTWIGQYEKAMAAGEAEPRAIALADQAVIDSQGSGQLKDLAQVQRGSPVAKLFMMFFSYGNTVFNETADAVSKTTFRSPASVGRFLGELGLLYLMPALGTVTMGALLGRLDLEDEEDFLTTVGGEMLSTALNTMIYVRELQNLVGEGTRGYAGPAGTRAFGLAVQLGTQIKQGELDESLWRAANATAGAVLGFPAAQAQRTIDGWVALEEGRSQNPAVLLVGPSREARR